MDPLSGLKLPISALGFISWLEKTAGIPATEEQRSVVEDITGLINAAYIDGMNGRAGYPQDPDGKAAGFAAGQGRALCKEEAWLITHLTHLRNLAYQEGRRVAEKGAEG